jgi:glycosyltransferase involved in cell wall biosynthesis
MNILHVSKKFPDAIGGDSVVVSNLLKHQVLNGHKVNVLTSNCDDILNDDYIYKFGLKDTPDSLDVISLRRIVSLVILLKSSLFIIRRFKPDVIHTHSIDMAFIVSIVAKFYRIPLVHTFHIVTSADSTENDVRGKIESILLRITKPKEIIVLNPSLIPKFHSRGFYNVHYIPNGVDVAVWRNNKTIQPDGFFRFVAVGRLEEQKGFEYLIRAASEVRKVSSEFKVEIIGDGSMMTKLQKLIDQLDLKSYVYLSGRKDHTEIKKIFERSNVFVLSSLWEGMPISLLEAWSANLPTISTDISGLKQIANGHSLFVKSKDIESLSNAMILTMKDKKIIHGLTKELKTFINGFKWENINDQIETIYEI